MVLLLLFLVQLSFILLPSNAQTCSSILNTDYSGNDISNIVAMSLAECCTLCWSYPNCKAFTFVASRTICYLKTAASAPVAWEGSIAGKKDVIDSVALQTKTSLGSYILIIGVSVLALYIIVGMIWNRTKNQYTGLDLIPNYQFWRSVPGLVQDGITYTIIKIKQIGNKTQSYEEIAMK